MSGVHCQGTKIQRRDAESFGFNLVNPVNPVYFRRKLRCTYHSQILPFYGY